MLKSPKMLIVAGCLMAVASMSYAGPDWLKGSTEAQLKTLADLQPGLGTVMIEYSRRFSTMYYAAKGGNWGMANYQLKEMREAQEVGEHTRPAHAPMLKDFESKHLDMLAASIKAKNLGQFKTAFKSAEKGCNSCHEMNGYPFIKYRLPARSPSPTSNRP